MGANTNNLQPNESLSLNEGLISANGRYQFLLQGDGNLVLTDRSNGQEPIWNAGTNGKGANVAIMQGDGNFVIYDNSAPKPIAVWESNTAGDGGAFLILQDDGNAVIYQVSARDARWNTRTAGR